MPGYEVSVDEVGEKLRVQVTCDGVCIATEVDPQASDDEVKATLAKVIAAHEAKAASKDRVKRLFESIVAP